MTEALQRGAEVSGIEDDQLRAAQDLARSVRTLCDRVIRFPAGEHTAAMAARLEELTDEMERHVRASEVPWYYDDPRTTRRMAQGMRRRGEARDEIGDFNPMMPPLRVDVRDGTLSGSVIVGPAFTGPPGLVHGGTQATILDHISGLLVASTGRPAVTARLETDYRRGAPIGEELALSAEIESIEGRKVRVRSRISSAGEACTVGHALFIVVPQPPLVDQS